MRMLRERGCPEPEFGEIRTSACPLTVSHRDTLEVVKQDHFISINSQTWILANVVNKTKQLKWKQRSNNHMFRKSCFKDLGKRNKQNSSRHFYHFSFSGGSPPDWVQREGI